MMTSSIPVSLQSIWKCNYCQLKCIREIIFLQYRSVPHWVRVYPWVFLNLWCLFATRHRRDIRAHQESGFFYILQSAFRHEQEVYGDSYHMGVSPGERRVFAVFPMGNCFGIWAAYPFSKAHQNTPPCLSSDSNNHIAPTRWF